MGTITERILRDTARVVNTRRDYRGSRALLRQTTCRVGLASAQTGNLPASYKEEKPPRGIESAVMISREG